MEMVEIPKWAREIDRYLSLKSQFILWGNVYDVYPTDYRGTTTTLKLVDYLKVYLQKQGV